MIWTELFNQLEPKEPLVLQSFLKVWRTKFPTLGVLHILFDARKNIYRTLSMNKNMYIDKFSCVKKNPASTEIHLTFYFAEKMLLPALKHHPSQLHFVTGLKFGIYEVASSNINQCFLYSLLEGHFSHEKMANKVISIVYNASHVHLVITASGSDFTRKLLHCNNCGCQNKNRWVLWYLCFLLLTSYNQVTLYFLIPGHRKIGATVLYS